MGKILVYSKNDEVREAATRHFGADAIVTGNTKEARSYLNNGCRGAIIHPYLSDERIDKRGMVIAREAKRNSKPFIVTQPIGYSLVRNDMPTFGVVDNEYETPHFWKSAMHALRIHSQETVISVGNINLDRVPRTY